MEADPETRPASSTGVAEALASAVTKSLLAQTAVEYALLAEGNVDENGGFDELIRVMELFRERIEREAAQFDALRYYIEAPRRTIMRRQPLMHDPDLLSSITEEYVQVHLAAALREVTALGDAPVVPRRMFGLKRRLPRSAAVVAESPPQKQQGEFPAVGAQGEFEVDWSDSASVASDWATGDVFDQGMEDYSSTTPSGYTSEASVMT